MSACIYRITNTVNQKSYIGQTRLRGGASARFLEHKRAAFNDRRRGCPKLYSAFRKYGADQFVVDIVEHVEDVAMLDDRERFWIAALQPVYNVAEGGTGSRHTEETRRKISAANRGRKLPPRSLEWRLKQRIAQRQRKRPVVTDATRAKLSSLMTGRKMPREAVEKSAATRRGVKRGPQTPEHIAKRVAARKRTMAKRKRSLSFQQG